MILNAMSTRTMGLSVDHLRTLFALPPSTPTANRFKVLLCKHCLADASAGGGRRPRPKPQARGAPRPTQITSTTNEPNVIATAAAATDQASNRRTLPALPAAEVLELLRGSSRTKSVELTRQLRFHLLTTYAVLQEQMDPSDADVDWPQLRSNGELERAIDAAFPVSNTQEGSAHVQSLRTLLDIAGLLQ